MENKEISNTLLRYRQEFDEVYQIISAHRKRVVRAVNNESMSMV